MKTIQKGILFTLFYFLITSVALAQNDRLERDIRIAEGILDELFRVTEGYSPVHSVSGQYLTGYGVHFMISPARTRTIRVSGRVILGERKDDARFEDEPEYATGKLDESEVNRRITEYLTSYAPLLTGLGDDEVVRVTYGLDHSPSVQAFFVGSSPGETREVSHPKLSVWVKSAELNRLKNGGITEAEFIERVNRYDFSELPEARDLNIFASILEASLKDMDTKNLNIRSKPTVEYIPGFGVGYNIQISSGIGFLIGRLGEVNLDINIDETLGQLNFDEMTSKLSAAREFRPSQADLDMDSVRVYVRVMGDSLREQARQIRVMSDSIRVIAPRQMGFTASEADTAEYRKDAEKIKEMVERIIRDYGATLTTLSDDELVMVTLNWGGRSKVMPLRTEIRIRKSDLIRGADPLFEDFSH